MSLDVCIKYKDASRPEYRHPFCFQSTLRNYWWPLAEKHGLETLQRLECLLIRDRAEAEQLVRELRVVENLLQNSLEYTPVNGRISLEAHERSGVEIAVSNTGRAIPLEARERIFEKFRRGPAASHAPGHAGLGLYFCKRAMEAHGGSVSVAETLEWPTTFVLHLPAV